MQFEKIEKNNVVCAVLNSEKKVFEDTQSALDILMSANMI